MQCPIREWFATHEDGDFTVARNEPFLVVEPKLATDKVIFCTKRHGLSRLTQNLGELDFPIAAIMRYGLPTENDLNELTSIVGTRRLLFLGDADPPDLLIFVWLRERIEIQYLGISDDLLMRCDVPKENHLTIPLSKCESDAMPLVTRVFENWQSHLGIWCSTLLQSGQKIELEAIFSFAKCSPIEMVTHLWHK